MRMNTQHLPADIGIIGLAVMGSNLARNMESHGYTVAVWNREPEMTEQFMQEHAQSKNLVAFTDLPALIASLKTPRVLFMMIRAGAPVDEMIDRLLPLLSPGDILIDGGNSYFGDTARRTKKVEACGMYYIGTGVSGGEEGALHGPSMMPGGSYPAWKRVRPILQAICAKVEDGSPCCDWVGEGGAGHFVKMVHNGIEYGDMQLICESYQLMHDGAALDNDRMHAVFDSWNKTELDSYLIGITADILAHKEADGSATLDRILDTAGQKGTGKWAVISALDEGTPLTLIGEAVFARCLSAQKEERVHTAQMFPQETPILPPENRDAFCEDLRLALYASKMVSYAQGYALLRSAAKTYGWNLNYGGIALMWRGGCIIRSVFLQKIKEAFERNPALENLLCDDYFAAQIKAALPAWRRTVAFAVANGIPVPAMSAALAYFDGLRTARLPANLLQAQRDYFGAHTYERTDAPRGQFFHTDWTGHGGDIASTVYQV